MAKPHLLLFQHLQSQRSPTRKWSYGVSVRHQVFGYQYMKYALPMCAYPLSCLTPLPPDCNVHPGFADASSLSLACACTLEGRYKLVTCHRMTVWAWQLQAAEMPGLGSGTLTLGV